MKKKPGAGKLTGSPVEDETYLVLKIKNALLEKELEKLWQLLILIMEKENPGHELPTGKLK